MIAYTIGHTANYNKSLIDNNAEDCIKVGRTNDYEGGWVWLTEEEAQSFIDSPEFTKIVWGDGKARDSKKFSVYKLDLVNGLDDIIKDDNQYFLLKDSRFFI